jgi:Flp pilus assembly protein TadG
MTRIHSRDRKRTAAVTLELAVVIALFLMILFGIFEYARLVMVRQVIQNAAREGARYAVVHTYDMTAPDVVQVVRQYLAGQERQLQNVSIRVYRADPNTGADLGTWSDAKFGECVAVQVTGDYRSVLPSFLLMPDPIPMRAVSMMYSEAN